MPQLLVLSPAVAAMLGIGFASDVPPEGPAWPAADFTASNGCDPFGQPIPTQADGSYATPATGGNGNRGTIDLSAAGQASPNGPTSDDILLTSLFDEAADSVNTASDAINDMLDVESFDCDVALEHITLAQAALATAVAELSRARRALVAHAG